MVVDRNIVFILIEPELEQRIARLFELRRHNILQFCHVHRKGYQCGRNVNLVKCSRHAVLTADGRKSVAYLGVVSAK